jgi:hypothetical protein
MPNTTNFQTFRDPAFSLWQSAIHATLLKHQPQSGAALAPRATGLAATADQPYMAASLQAMNELIDPRAPGQFAARAAGPLGTIVDCAKLYAQIAWDELFNRANVPALKNELTFGSCDAFWAECLAVYEGFILSGQQQPYTPYPDISQGVLNNLNDDATIAIIGDWGTGMGDALVLLQQIADNFHPDVLIHLGDIYYSGLPSECSEHFTAVINQVWPTNPPLVFTLDGNHDRYAGAAGGYYDLIKSLNQPNSYFALRNNFWQFVAMDTGYHDTNPYTVNTNLTYLEQTEIDWHLDKIKNNGAGVDATLNPSGVRGTVLLSHHQLISAAGLGNDKTTGKPLAVNTNLANAFAPVFPLIDFWLWGHEHDLCIFEPYTMGPGQPLPPGRCIGASAVPQFIPATPNPANLVIPSSETGPPQIIAGTALQNNKTVFYHAYAIVTLQGCSLTINYYQFDSSVATPGKPPAPTPLAYSDSVSTPAVVRRAIGA